MENIAEVTIHESIYSKDTRFNEILLENNCIEVGPNVGDIMYRLFLKDPNENPKKYLWGLIRIKPKRLLTDFIKEDRCWTFYVSKKQDLDLCKKLAAEIASIYEIKVEIVTDFKI